VITEVNEYDFGLPGSGILIWHVDERIIAENFEANLVNGDRERRGIDLEEADGAQDIGQVYGLLSPGSGAENGVIEDMFWASNPINMLVNDSSAVVEFTPTTTPNSLSNSGANTGIFITDFSEPAEVMTFSVRENLSQPGFPQFVGATGPLTNSPTVADLDQDGKQEIIWASNEDTKVFVWNSDGSKFVANDQNAQVPQLNGDIKTFPLALFAEPDGTFAYPPVVARFNGQDLVLVVVTDRVIAIYAPEDQDQDGRGDVIFVRRNLQGFTAPPMVVNTDPNQVLVGTEAGAIVSYTDQASTTLVTLGSGSIVGLAVFSTDAVAFATSSGMIGVLSLNGNLLWQSTTEGAISVPPVVADLDRDGRLDVVVLTETGELSAFDAAGEHLGGFPEMVGVERPSHMALGDVNGDGFLEIHFYAHGELYAFNHIGSLIDNFPIRTFSDPTSNLSSPILADLSGDGLPEIIIGSVLNQVAAYEASGKAARGFPLSVGAGVNSTAAVSDLNNDGDLDIAAVSDDGFLYAWDLQTNFTPATIAWGGFLRDAGHSNANLEIIGAPPSSGKLMPANLVYNYPNPTEGNRTTIRYLLNRPAEVAIKIYDMAGELVDELAGPGFGQAENEIDWRTDNIESGVYLARVEARTETDSDIVIFKIAVVK
ncbi:T9SS type A sorting domain-containing protein, partial [bacterium]|nr:T9SS type A sorting domain-containing protein [bacterium]